MELIIAEDDPLAAELLRATLESMGHEVEVCLDGQEAWDLFKEKPVSVVLSDWDMPEVDGMELTRRIRGNKSDSYTYIILITAKASKNDYATAMDTGVDDFLTKPIDLMQLNMRLRVAERIVTFRAEFDAMKRIIPICSYCKSIRNDDDYWQQLEYFLEENLEKDVSHGICPTCFEKEVIPQIDELEKKEKRT
jgi:DNA-binding response OmpR family regulator